MHKIDGLKIQLYPHQIKGVEMIENHEYERKLSLTGELINSLNHDGIPCQFNAGDTIETKVGIYGDITGYGKTLTMCAYLMRYYNKLRKNQDYLKGYSKTETIKVQSLYNAIIRHCGVKTETYNFLPQTLIVVNKQINSQWEMELSRTDLKYLAISYAKQIPTSSELENYEVVLVTNTMSRLLHQRFINDHWARLIVDEPTENLVPQLYMADFYWLITASYDRIPVRTQKQTIFKHLFPTYYYYQSYIRAVTIKNDDEFVKKSYKLPDIEVIHHQCYERSLAHLTHSFLSSEISGMIKAGNIKEAILRLGGTSSNVNIFELVTKKKKEDMADAEHWYNKYHQKFVVEKNREFKNNYEKWRDRRNKLQLEIKELNDKYQESLDNGCTVCANDFSDNKIILVPCCQNIVCGICLIKWMDKNPTCVFCRTAIDESKLIYLEKNPLIKEGTTAEKYGNGSKKTKAIVKLRRKRQTRLETIISLIKGNPMRKFIIVSIYDETFLPIKNHLDSNQINYAEIKGHKAHIDKEIQQLKNGECRVVFLNGRYQGTGLNLQMMSDIILYHSMEPSIITQIMGRINRIGSNEVRNFIKPRMHQLMV